MTAATLVEDQYIVDAGLRIIEAYARRFKTFYIGYMPYDGGDQGDWHWWVRASTVDENCAWTDCECTRGPADSLVELMDGLPFFLSSWLKP